jgi:hypothetical protein
MSAAQDENPAGALAADGADPPLGYCVRAGRANWRADDCDLFCGEHGIETGDELGVAIPDQEMQSINSITEIHEQITSLHWQFRPGRFGFLRGWPGGGVGCEISRR